MYKRQDYFILKKDKILLHHITYRKSKWDDEKGHRNVNDFLGITPSISSNKLALILNAQTMNSECQNALLKNLEEPAPNTYIIMTTDRSNALLETIYSRCQVINIPNLSSDDINAWLSKIGISDINANDFPSFYSPLSIIDDIENDFSEGLKGIKMLPLEAKFGVFMAYRYYSQLLKKLKKTPALEIKNTRIRVPNYKKIELLTRSYVKYHLNLL